MKCREWSVDSSLLAHIPRRSTMEDRAGSLLLAVFSLASRACVQALLDRSRKTVGPREWSSPPTKNGFRKADSVVVHRPCYVLPSQTEAYRGLFDLQLGMSTNAESARCLDEQSSTVAGNNM